jgi:hypothetical protein
LLYKPTELSHSLWLRKLKLYRASVNVENVASERFYRSGNLESY